MEFKSIEQLSITDCCHKLSITRERLKQTVIDTNNNISLFRGRLFGEESLGKERTGNYSYAAKLRNNMKSTFQK